MSIPDRCPLSYLEKVCDLLRRLSFLKLHPSRPFSVSVDITICPSTETYFGLYLRGVMSAVTGINLFRLLLNNVFFLSCDLFFTLTNSAHPDEMPHDGISPILQV